VSLGIRNSSEHYRRSLKFDGSNFILLEWPTAFFEKDTATWIAQKLSAVTEFGSLMSCSQKSTILVWKYSEAANLILSVCLYVRHENVIAFTVELLVLED
jgi:hypothetical protein